MRQLIIGTAIAFALLSVAGCAQSDFQPFAQPNRRKPSLDSQLQAAAALHNPRERDDVIALVAKDAANVGDVHWATQALKAISDWEVRDNAALAVAVRLSRGGKNEAAREIAGLIASSVIKIETLKLITKAK
ncbi:MAG: hypothetical protein ACM3U2_02890 [Deltaproteobacteria bacterium]